MSRHPTELEKTLAIFALLLVMALIRLPALTADHHASFGSFWMNDEGWWVHNARNKVLFGRWVLDDFNQSLTIAPVFCFASYLSFSWLGVGLFQARLVSALSGILTLGLLYGWLRSTWGRQAALLSSILLGTNFVLIGYSRMAVPEALVILLLMATCFFWQRGERRPFWAFFSGVSLVLAWFTHPVATFFIPVPFSVWILQRFRKDEQKASKHLLFYFVGGVVVCVALFLGVFLHSYWDDFRSMNLGGLRRRLPFSSHYAVARSVLDLGLRIVGFPFHSLFWRMPFLLSVVSIYSILLIHRKGTGFKDFLSRIDSTELLVLGWAFYGTVFIALSPQFSRHFVPVIPALCILAGKGLSAFREVDWGRFFAFREGGKVRMRLVLSAALLLYPLVVAAGPIVDFLGSSAAASDRYTGAWMWGIYVLLVLGIFVGSNVAPRKAAPWMASIMSRYPGIILSWAVLTSIIFWVAKDRPYGGTVGLSFSASASLALVVIVVCYALASGVNYLRGEPHRMLRKSRYALLLAAVVWVHSVQLGLFFSRLTYDVVQLSRTLGDRFFDRGTVVVGHLADTLSMENEAFSIVQWQRSSRSVMERFRPEYLLSNGPIVRRNAFIRLEDSTIRLVRGATIDLIERFPIIPRRPGKYRSTVYLYKVSYPPEPAS